MCATVDSVMSARGKIERIFQERNEEAMIETASLFHKRQRAPQRLGTALICGILCVLALGVRVALYPVITGDYTVFVSQWYDYVLQHGGFAALKDDFSNYNPPYLYLLAIATYLPIPKLIAIKSISVLFDAVLALFILLILRQRAPRSALPAIGALAVLFTPTVTINSAAWGQCDAIYAAFCVGSLYFLLRRRPAWACVCFGLAIAFKLQAVFFAPVLLLFALKRELPLRYLLLIPIVFLVLLTPAYLAGRDAASLLTVYSEQMETGGVGGVGGAGGPLQAGPGTPPQGQAARSDSARRLPAQGAGSRPHGGFGGRGGFTSLTYNAPTIYQWLDGTPLAQNKLLGTGLAALAIVLVAGLLLVSRARLSAPVVLNASLLCALAIPFCLPEMHERYFYLADVIAILYACWFPRWFGVAIAVQLVSLLSYAPYMLRTPIVSLWYVAFVVLGLVLLLAGRLVQSVRQAAPAAPS